MKFKCFLVFLLLCSQSLLFAASSAEETEERLVSIVKTEKHSDWQKDEHYFQIELDNHQKFYVKVSLQDLLEDKLHKEMDLRLADEAFVLWEPGVSLFTYETLDGMIQFQGNKDSIHSWWHPDETQHPLLEVKEVEYTRLNGMSYYGWRIAFSDNTKIEIGDKNYRPHLEGAFKVGGLFYRINKSKFVDFSSGRIVDTGNPASIKFTKITW